MLKSKSHIFACLVIIIVGGCVATGQDILTRDYSKMSDEELLRYYYELEEEIDKCEHRSTGTAIGFGTGFGIGRRAGMGFGVNHGVYECDSTHLRDRRIEVRLALKKRGLNP